MKTSAEETTDDRDQDVDFWFLDTSAKAPMTNTIYFYGSEEGEGVSLGGGLASMAPGTKIIADEPVILGYDNISIGTVIKSTGTVSVTLDTILGPTTLSACCGLMRNL